MYRLFRLINPYLVKNYEVQGPYKLYFLILKSFTAPATTTRYNPMTRAWRICLGGVTSKTFKVGQIRKTAKKNFIC